MQSMRPVHHLDTDGNLHDDDAIVDIDQDFESVWRRVENVVSKRDPAGWELYAPFLQMKVAGFSTKEIAVHTKMTRNKAAQMVNEARQMVRDSCNFDREFPF